MKFYRCSKSLLNFKEMKQFSFNWKLPILVDHNKNVILGNSLKDSLPNTIIVIVVDGNGREPLFEALFEVEEKVVEEHDPQRLVTLQGELRQYLYQARKVEYEYEPLFSHKETACITPETYIEPPPYEFNKHGRTKDDIFNDGNLLSEEFYQFFESEKPIKEKEPAIKVDMELLKELL